MAAITETITIRIREDGSREVVRRVGDIGDAANRAEAPVNRLKTLLATVVTGATLAMFARMADEYTNLQNRLRLVTTDSANLARITRELGTIANQTRSDFSATAELYARMATSSKELGLSQRELLNFTKSLNQAVILSGASAEEAAGGIRQLSQGMASGTLRGDELNSVLENLPAVADIIAQGLGITRGELRKMGQEGKLTATAIIDAFKQAEEELEQGFGTTVPTMGQAFTVLRNNFMLWLGEMDQAYGVSARFAELLLTIANNLDKIIPALLGVATGVAAAFVPGLIQSFTAQIRALWTLLLANPFVAVAAAVAGLTAYVVMMRDEIRLGIDDTTSLGDLMRAAWEGVSSGIAEAWGHASTFFTSLVDESKQAWGEVTRHADEGTASQEAWWLRLLRHVTRVLDMIGGVVRGTFAGMLAVAGEVIRAMMNNFTQLGNAIKAAMNLDGQGILDAATANIEGWKEAGGNLGSAFSDAFRDQVLLQDSSGIESILDGWIARAQEIGRERTSGGGENPLSGGGSGISPVDEEGVKKAARELEKLRGQLRSVLDTASPVDAATRQLADAHDILARSVAAGLLTQDQAILAYEALAYQLRDQIDPLGALNREIEENIELLQMSANERQVEAQLLQSTAELRRAGVILTQEETDALRARLVVEQELARISQMRDQIEAQTSQGQIERINDMMAAMQGMTDLTEGDRFNILNDMLGGSLDSMQSEFETRIDMLQQYYDTVEMFRQNDLISEQMASDAKRALKQAEMDLYISATAKGLGQVAQLMGSHNKQAFKIGQAAAIAQVAVTTPKAAMDAYSAMAGIPYVGPILGAAAAAAAVVMGMQQISQIRSQQMPGFRTGGSMVVGGSGGPDSQTVAFRATPGEKVSVHTPAQARALERLAEDASYHDRGPRVFNSNTTIVQQGRPDNKTADQQARALRRQQRREWERVN